MMFSCEICKHFILAANALQYEETIKHYFYQECVFAFTSLTSSSLPGAFHCTVCKRAALLRQTAGLVLPREATAPPTFEAESVKGMVASFLGKMSAIEAQLWDLPIIRMQLQDLLTIIPQLASFESKLIATSETLTSSLTELRGQHAALDRRIAALESGPKSRNAQVKLNKLASKL